MWAAAGPGNSGDPGGGAGKQIGRKWFVSLTPQKFWTRSRVAFLSFWAMGYADNGQRTRDTLFEYYL